MSGPPFDKAARYDELRASDPSLTHEQAVAEVEQEYKAAQYDFLRSKNISHEEAIRHIEAGSKPLEATRQSDGWDTALDVARAGVQGATFGLSDEIAGGLDALDRNSGPGTMKDRYLARRNKERQLLETGRRDSPTASRIAEFVGGAAIPVGGFASVARGAPALIKAAAGAGIGGATGLLAGAGYSQGDPKDIQTPGDVADSAGQGGKAGLLTGAVLPFVGPAIGSVARHTPLVGRVARPLSEALRKAKARLTGPVKSGTPWNDPHATPLMEPETALGPKPDYSAIDPNLDQSGYRPQFGERPFHVPESAPVRQPPARPVASLEEELAGLSGEPVPFPTQGSGSGGRMSAPRPTPPRSPAVTSLADELASLPNESVPFPREGPAVPGRMSAQRPPARPIPPSPDATYAAVTQALRALGIKGGEVPSAVHEAVSANPTGEVGDILKDAIARLRPSNAPKTLKEAYAAKVQTGTILPETLARKQKGATKGRLSRFAEERAARKAQESVWNPRDWLDKNQVEAERARALHQKPKLEK